MEPDDLPHTQVGLMFCDRLIMSLVIYRYVTCVLHTVRINNDIMFATEIKEKSIN